MIFDVTSADSIALMADLIRNEHRSLKTMTLSPAGAFQSRTTTLATLTREVTECLTEKFRGRAAHDFPMLYFACGKARVGSTALSNLFGMTGLPSYYQPVKAMFRNALVGLPLRAWAVPDASDAPGIFSKETIGPYVLAESLFNPLELLVEAGYPTDRLHLIALDREPASALASWLDKFSSRTPASTLTGNYVLAAHSAGRVKNYAARHGIPVTHYVYELSKDPLPSVRLLFDRLGLAERFTETAVTCWETPDHASASNARVIFPAESPLHNVPNLHTSDSAYRYQSRATGTLTTAQLDLLERCGVNDVYRASVAACIRDLGLNATTSARMFGERAGVAA